MVAQVSQSPLQFAVVSNTSFPGATAAAGVLAASKRNKYKSQVPRIEVHDQPLDLRQFENILQQNGCQQLNSTTPEAFLRAELELQHNLRRVQMVPATGLNRIAV